MALFEATEVSKQFGTQMALDRVSISVPEKSIFGLLGPNGAGKTTLIRIINQITGPDSGKLYLNGRKLTAGDVTKIGYLPEERGLYKKMKVGEQILYFAQLKGLSKAEAYKRAKYWFRKLEIIDWWDKKVEELSKGMQQKAQFVSTVLHEPDLLIFDEPFSGFDPVNANAIKNEVLFLRERGATVIFSTHNMSSVEELCDDISLINKGKVILQGRVGEIRKTWAQNEYEVVFSNKPDIPAGELYRVVDKIIDDGRSVVRISAEPDVKSNDLIKDMMKAGNIISFNPALPSMNDIFIKVVQSKNETVDA
ncbi:MAG: ATP-binding cassette domain-containing protein [Bacteroidales bacterium]|jgi:ABC-2 type transport system ATP-binding protein|nr:ATP-binding cassette domain-containing protein [Bacteroidales bacterium]